jgi:tetratricopeptide (TPR) repeat protein
MSRKHSKQKRVRTKVLSKKTSSASFEQINAQLSAFGRSYSTHVQAGDFAAALEVTKQAHALVPQHPKVIGDAALCYLRLGNYDRARSLYERACALTPQDTNLWDGLTEVCGRLGLKDKVRLNGKRALELKDEQSTGNTVKYPPLSLSDHPPPPLSTDALRNIIAFSLFGDKPRYCETAMLNVRKAGQLLPQWTCRFYVDETVPLAVRTRLQHLGAQVQLMDERDRVELSGLMWRFLVMQDPDVDRFLLRDADSLISFREVAAVQEWLQSGRYFHLMRDYYTHTELLLAGMVGGSGGVFKNIRQLMVRFIKDGQYSSKRVVDQHFLRYCVWPTVRQSLLSHDSMFDFKDAQPFPSLRPHGLGESFHVGSNLSCASIGAKSDLPNGQTVMWAIRDENDHEVCRYNSTVLSGSWRAELPQPYIDDIQNGLWRVVIC